MGPSAGPSPVMLDSVESFPGVLVISLDLELQWGVRDSRKGDIAYLDRLYGAREVVPRLLELFQDFGVAATWAVVGFLFAESREELERFSPALKPGYADDRFSPYGDLIGEDERDDPLHYAPSLIAEIRRTPDQEIATHTFSHYYCLEKGQSREAFRSDLEAATQIAARRGVRFRSIVFPRNQHNPEYDDILAEAGIRAYRGNPCAPVWNFSGRKASRVRWKRARRLLDAYLGPAERGVTSWTEITRPTGLSDVRATTFLRPYSSLLRPLERIRLDRLCRTIRYAAESGQIVHLWWHPHNFGLHQEENLRFLRGVLEEFKVCRERYGMHSLTMAEVDARLRNGPTGRLLGKTA